MDLERVQAALLQPLEIKSVLIRNRLMSTAHTSGAGTDGLPTERYQRYHEEKARGGIGLTVIGGSTAVAPDTPGADMLHLDASTDAIIPHYAEIADRVHRHGAAIFAQLSHLGRRANYDKGNWLPPISPSRVREAAHRAYPKAMDAHDIARVVDSFGAAAARVRAGGIDGVELSATHGHLIDQFWSPRVNWRDDEYGGSIENRVRFSLEVLSAVRSAVGSAMVVGVRMSLDELIEDGLTHPECIAIAQALARGGADYLSVLGGQAESLPAHAVIFPNMEARPAPFLGLAGSLKQSVDVPVFYAQRVTDLGTAARAIEDGLVDMVGMTRAHLADPHIVSKLRAGRVDEIRPCVGANYCIDRLYAGGQAFCLHNPATGRERTMPHTYARAERRKRIVVVGGGPAGLEAARICAERGHSVVLFERERHLGGALRLAGSVTWRGGLLDIVRWLERRICALGVDVRTESEADVGMVLAEAPELVIVATGGVAAKPPMFGADAVMTAREVLAARPRLTGDVLLFDDNGAEPALSTAEVLAEDARSVRFVTADPSPGALLERTTRPSFLRRLYNAGVRFTVDTRLDGVIRDGDALVGHLRNEYSGQQELVRADHVIVEYGTVPADSVFESLRERSTNDGVIDLDAFVDGRPQPGDACEGFRLYRVGDAIASRNVHAAMLDALRLCKDF